VAVGDARIAVHAWGDPGAPPVLLLHKAGAASSGLQVAMRVSYRRLSDQVAAALRAGMREEEGEVVGIAGPEVAGATRLGLLRERVSPAWPELARAGVAVLLLLAGRTEEAVERDAPWAARFRDAVPQADVRLLEGWAHDLPIEGGPELARLVAAWLARSA
jgi:pimeloyl-ACP methyl ester carboxylesterase